MKILLINYGMHNKNLNAIKKYTKLDIDIIDHLQNIDITKYDVVYSPSEPIDVSNFPDKNFIFGPHFSTFPNHKIKPIINKNTIYIQPSEWVVKLWKEFDICENLDIRVLPFGVDTEKFNQTIETSSRNKVFVYFKNRNPLELRYIEHFLSSQNIQYVVFDYKKTYNEQEYLDYLHNAKYGIWLGCHESQGFALEEALSCNVPLFVWSVKSMNQEYGSNYYDIPATTLSYWDERCGEFTYDIEKFYDKFQKFLMKLETYRPREYILENLSMDVCEKKFIDLLKQYIDY
jgi:glycosyltransferase involved in cell wall biosynthesis